MFLGAFLHTLQKGRVTLPRRLLPQFAAGILITKGQDGCLDLYTREHWEVEAERLRQLPRTDRRNRNFRRAFFAGAAEVEPDQQGRIPIPAELREYASLVHRVAFACVDDHVELWDEARWKAISSEADRDYSQGG